MICRKCNLRVHDFILLDTGVTLCAHCGIHLAPNNNNLIRIAVAESGICPICQALAHQFHRSPEDMSTLLCQECGGKFRVLCPLALCRDYTKAILDPEGEISSSDAEENKETDPPPNKIFENRLLKSLGMVTSLDDLRASLTVDYYNFRAYIDPSEKEQAALLGLDRSVELALELKPQQHPENATYSSIIDTTLQVANRFASGCKLPLTLIIELLLGAINRASQQNAARTISGAIAIKCPNCDFAFHRRDYLIVLGDEFDLAKNTEYFTWTCPQCRKSISYCLSLAIIHRGRKELVYFTEPLRGPIYERYLETVKSFCLASSINIEQLVQFKYDDFNELLWHFDPERGTSHLIRLLPGDVSHAFTVFRALGAAYVSFGQYLEAATCYGLAAVFDPTCRENYQGLASSLASLCRYEQALKALVKMEAITDQAGRYVRISASRSGCQIIDVPDWAKAADVDRATVRVIYRTLTKSLNRFLEDHPDDQEMCSYLCDAYRLLGEEHDTIKTAFKTLAIEPISAWSELARLALQDVGFHKIPLYIRRQLR